MAVAPGKLGIAAFSPPLDPFGNSVRAQKAVATVAQRLGLNLYSA
jgi:glutaminase